ncbi:MAG: molybdopterin-dependent oxidoreductase [Myxococcales bacterium]|nr:molybdopterin-dependent oxidoreductase [Myxococcales bacterium]
MQPLHSERGASRREILAGLGALVVAVQLPSSARASTTSSAPSSTELGTLNAFVGVGTDGVVTVICPAQELGQGSSTGVAQIVADELDAAWDDVRVVLADEGKQYRVSIVPLLPASQGTGGSFTIRAWLAPLRKAGARARAMLVAAAAERWGVRTEDCVTTDSVVRHPDGHEATYGELAEDAARQRAPRNPTLKTRDQFEYMGRSMPREDLAPKLTGQTQYGIDIRLPGMVYACPVASPVNGGRVDSVDDRVARSMPGVLDVLVFDTFVAVVAKGWWQAKQAMLSLEITWDAKGNGAVGSAAISKQLRANLDAKRGYTRVRKRGNVKRALEDADQVIEADYEVPYLEHATMEPLNCTVHAQSDRCEIWTSTQQPTRTVNAIRKLTGMRAEQIILHPMYVGGGYGRRGNVDWVEQAVQVAQRVDSPVQVLWTREEQTRHGFYRPPMMGRLRAAIQDGRLTALHARITGDSSSRGWLPGLQWVGLVKRQLAEGMSRNASPYDYHNVLVEVLPQSFHLNVGFWRSVNQSFTAFFRETFLDDVAAAIGQDPLELRRSLLEEDQPRVRAVLDKAAQLGRWGEAPEGHHQGIGLVNWAGAYCAQVVEITIENDQPRIQRLSAAIDCGVHINPDQVRAQVMGGAIFGLSSALGEAITVKEGRVEQSNFNDYPILRMSQSPYTVDVHVMDRPDDPPRGVGEPGTPPAIPALCNAIFAATGKRVRHLPIPRTLSALD